MQRKRHAQFAIAIYMTAILCSDLSLAAPPHAARIFRCVVDGTTTYSDKACPLDAGVETDVRIDNSYDPIDGQFSSPTHAASRTPSARVTRIRRSDGKQVSDLETARKHCESIREKLTVIQNHMRAGYKPSEERRLRERRRSLEEQQRRANCHG